MKLECANCGKVFDKDDDILTITDNQLILVLIGFMNILKMNKLKENLKNKISRQIVLQPY